MKFTIAFIVSILTSSVYGLATAPIAREDANIEVMLAKLCIKGWRLTIRLIIDSRHAQVPPELVVILVMPCLSYEHTVQDNSITSTRQTLQNF